MALFAAGGPCAALMYGAALPLNLLRWAPGLTLHRASRVDIAGTGAFLAQADGDAAGCVPLSITDAAAPLRIVVA